MEFRFSVVMAAYNAERYIRDALDSIIHQSLDFKSNIQIVIVNDASSDNTLSICQSYKNRFPDNIVLINNKINCGPAHSRNLGLRYATGEIINFLDSDDYISKKAFEKADIFLDDFVHVDIVSIPVKFVGSKRGDHPLNYKFNGTGVINLLQNPDAIQLSAASSFFRSDILKGITYNHKFSDYDDSVPMVFNERLSVSEDALLINQILLRNPLLGIMDDCTYYYRKKETDDLSLISDSANHRSYFTTRVENYFIKLINESLRLYDRVPEFIQHAIMYDLQWIMEIMQVHHLLSSEDLSELYDRLIYILFYIGDKVIFSQRHIPSILKAHIILIKYFKWDYLDTKTFSFDKIDKNYYTHHGNLVPYIGKNELAFIIQKLELNKVYLDIVEVRNRKAKVNLNDGDEKAMDIGGDGEGQELYVSGVITSFLNRDFDIYAVVSDRDSDRSHVREQEFRARKLIYPQRDNLSLNFNYGYNHNFEVSIPIKYKNSRISFRTSFKNLNGVCEDLKIRNESPDTINHHDLNFSGDLLIDYNQTSRLSRISRYKISRDYLLLDGGNHIIVTERKFHKLIRNEFSTQMSMLSERQEGWRTGLLLRVIYFILYPFYRNRRIWIFMDLPYTADDNGIQLYKYVKKIDNLDLNEYNSLLELGNDSLYKKRHPYKYELFEGKDIKITDLIKDLFTPIKKLRENNPEEEENTRVKFIKNGDLGLSDVEYDDDFDDYLIEQYDLKDENKDKNNKSNSPGIVSSFEEDIKYASKFRKNLYDKSEFVKGIDSKIDTKYNSMLNSIDGRLDNGYKGIKNRVQNTDIKERVSRDKEDSFTGNYGVIDAVFNFNLSRFLSENRFVYLLKYILYRISGMLRGTSLKSVDNRKIRKYFTLEQSTGHFNNLRHLDNQYMASSNRSKLKKLFAREKESDEYKSLKSIGPVLAYKSLKHRIYALYAELIVSSHPDNNIIYPFFGNFPHLAGLVKAKTVFLQHGVIKEDISFWLNKFDKNLDMIVTSADKEKESFLSHFDDDGNYIQSFYGYESDVIQVLGLSRFDYLERKEDKKEIVIMPSWRRQFHDYDNDEFVETGFFKHYNELLNDDKLISALEDKGYRLVFKPHPNLNKFIPLFNKDKHVEFDLNDLNYEGEKYNSRRYIDIFNHSSLVVTDFSSVFFDFAYLKKPVVYYHYDNDYHYDSVNGYFDYETMGFGPVVHDCDELVESILRYVDNDCVMEEEYKNRIDAFFKYTDRDNCKRTYKAILELDKYY